MAKDEILAAIRQAAGALGRAPSRGELKRLTGVSHYRVLSEFRTLREAVRAAGLEPNPKGERISTGELLKDWQRVARKLGRKPTRSEYVREGKYSAGALTVRFGAWGKIGQDATSATVHNTRQKAQARGHRASNHQEQSCPAQGRAYAAMRGVENAPDKALAMRWAASLMQIPGELAGKRRVTEAVAQLVVNTLLGESRQHAALSFQSERTHHGGAETRRATGADDGEALLDTTRFDPAKGTTRISAGTAAEQLQEGDTTGAAVHKATSNACPVKVELRKDLVRKDRAVMGPPFDASRLTNAPMNELGVVFLFGMMAAELGFQVESLQGRFPDCEAKREVHPGKWQRSRIEFEYESKNFALHGHDPQGCDVIVCWRHNWRECPPELEVVELCRMVGSG